MIAPDPPQDRRERRRATRRRQIADAALRIVVDEGVDALTMPKLARELDVAVGGLYRYFESKDRLLVAIELVAVDAFSQRLNATMEALTLPTDQPLPVIALARAWVLLRSWTQFSSEEPVYYRLIEALTADARTLLDDTAAQELQAHIDPVTSRCASILEEAVTVGALDPGSPDLRVYVLWGALQGIALFRKQDHRRPDHLSASAIADEAIASLLLGWGAPPDVLAEARRITANA